MSVDFARYLQQVELPTGGMQAGVLFHESSCSSLAGAAFTRHLRPPPPRLTTPTPTPSPSSPCLQKNRKNLCNLETKRRHSAASRSCLRPRGSATAEQECRSGGGSMLNHWSLAQGYSSTPNLAVYLGRALTLHSSPRIKRRPKKKRVKFADEQGETLVTFYIVPKIEIQETDYWSFIQQTVHNRDFYDEDVESEDEDFCGPCSPDDTEFPWGPAFNFSPSPSSPSAGQRSPSRTVSTSSPSTSPAAEDRGPTCRLCFEQPAADFSAFQQKLEQNSVCLENAKVDAASGVVTCSIKVRNLHPVKRVFARCTSDLWVTHADLPASYAHPGYDCSVYDNFSFAITKPLHKDSRTVRCEFAVCYQVDGQTFWDNNEDVNYAIEWTGDCS